jgi:transglutaminase-like putative cysteine protease
MRFKIVHETEYSFSSEIFLEPHYLRFKPKITPFNRLESFILDISPNPSGISEQIDTENNLVHFCWFEGLTKKFKIKAESMVKIQEHNPFNFILYPSDYLNFPFTYPEALKDILSPSLKVVELSKALIEYGNSIKDESKFNTVQFITNLTKQINSDFTLEYRYEGVPFEPDKTFEHKNGSCRDLTWMQIQLLRHMGIAARFVSGYYYIPLENPDFELHAWTEVYLPGAGWIGFDPSNGIVAGLTHIPIATSAQFENTMPVTGNIRGDASSDLTTNLFIEAIN